ncbi:MAG: type IV toxin-antitoxin system AbiEi family antitoxin domain-containing protein, partial [Elusimicrobiota bacterium]
MGKIKKKVKKVLKDSPVFTNRDVNMVTEDRSYTDLFLHNLVKNGEAYRLTKGCYSWAEDPFLSVFCFRPAYLGLEFALSFYGIWDQETNPAIITSKKVRAGRREVLGTNINLYRIKRDYFFGIDYLKHDEFYLPVSDIEKTVLDLIYFNTVPDKNTWKR